MVFTEYQCRHHLNIYDSPKCDRLATQAAAGRHLHVSATQKSAIAVCLCEDDYSGWLKTTDITALDVASVAYRAHYFTESEIKALLPQVIAFTHAAMRQPNYYLWGGTVGPNYDCSGLMQAAFAAVGVWLPRDAYQQEEFTQTIAMDALEVGDLIFFGNGARATHVGLYVGDGCYIHSSGVKVGRNGIGIDRLSELGDVVSRSYYLELRACGRVVRSYVPQSHEGH